MYAKVRHATTAPHRSFTRACINAQLETRRSLPVNTSGLAFPMRMPPATGDSYKITDSIAPCHGGASCFAWHFRLS
jgi:hypothetical protein